MKIIFLHIILLLAGTFPASGQETDPFVSRCALTAGKDAKYLKDFKIQLGQAETLTDLRFRGNMALWKNTRYRFSMCDADNSKGKLILSLRDGTNKLILSSYDKISGEISPHVDFKCNKSGIYQLYYDFENGQQGSGIGVVSMLMKPLKKRK